MHLTKSITEPELIQRCKNGGLKYQEMLYKHFYGYAMGIALRYSNGRDNAMEVTNDAFIKVFASINKYDPDKPFKAWLRRIVVNSAIDRQRREQRYKADDLTEAEHIGSLPHVIEQLNANDILKLMATLPQLHRTVFNLYEIDGYSHDEIAAMLDIATSSSRVYLTRAKEKLRELLSK